MNCWHQQKHEHIKAYVLIFYFWRECQYEYTIFKDEEVVVQFTELLRATSVWGSIKSHWLGHPCIKNCNKFQSPVSYFNLSISLRMTSNTKLKQCPQHLYGVFQKCLRNWVPPWEREREAICIIKPVVRRKALQFVMHLHAYFNL